MKQENKPSNMYQDVWNNYKTNHFYFYETLILPEAGVVNPLRKQFSWDVINCVAVNFLAIHIDVAATILVFG